MKVAVSASGKDLDTPIDPRFGRCAYFLIIDTEDMSFEAFDNESVALSGGAGIQASQFVASKGVTVVITGNVGPNAVRTLEAASVKVIVGQSGTVRQAIKDYKDGKLKSTDQANVADHYGMGGDMGRGGGMGRGMGGGMGCGGGMGRGMGRGMDIGEGDEGQDLKRLKDQANELRKQVEAIESAVKNLEKK
jgi:predicted Fe-Mo cluster-binding NifX family protein